MSDKYGTLWARKFDWSAKGSMTIEEARSIIGFNEPEKARKIGDLWYIFTYSRNRPKDFPPLDYTLDEVRPLILNTTRDMMVAFMETTFPGYLKIGRQIRYTRDELIQICLDKGVDIFSEPSAKLYIL